MKPRYEHDCDTCVFVDQIGGVDLYACSQGGEMPTWVARFSDEGPDYSSHPDYNILKHTYPFRREYGSAV